LKFFGFGPTIDTSIISAALVLLYLKEKSIWPCIVVHGINDALAFLIFPLLI
jgi:membrane protease YdiL (CAAX protease family)